MSFSGGRHGIKLRQHRRGYPVPSQAVRAADHQGSGSRCGTDLRPERSQRAIEGQAIFQGEMRLVHGMTGLRGDRCMG